MIYSLKGKLIYIENDFIVVEAMGIGFQVFFMKNSIATLELGSQVELFCYLHLKEGGIELYGFKTQKEMSLFKLLNSVSGVGPKSALAIMGVAKTSDLLAAIKEGRSDLLVQASGIGSKVAQRIILELKNKVEVDQSDEVVLRMQSDQDLIEALVGLGYKKEEVKSILSNMSGGGTLEERLKLALKNLSHKK